MHQAAVLEDETSGSQRTPQLRLASGNQSGGCYGTQVLIAGRRKSWRDSISTQCRLAGFNATTVDSAVDALTVLVLGLPCDVLLTDADLRGDLCCSRLASEALALRPNIGIVFAGEPGVEEVDSFPNAGVLLPGAYQTGAAHCVREMLASRAA